MRSSRPHRAVTVDVTAFQQYAWRGLTSTAVSSSSHVATPTHRAAPVVSPMSTISLASSASSTPRPHRRAPSLSSPSSPRAPSAPHAPSSPRSPRHSVIVSSPHALTPRHNIITRSSESPAKAPAGGDRSIFSAADPLPLSVPMPPRDDGGPPTRGGAPSISPAYARRARRSWQAVRDAPARADLRGRTLAEHQPTSPPRKAANGPWLWDCMRVHDVGAPTLKSRFQSQSNAASVWDLWGSKPMSRTEYVAASC